MPNVQKKWFFKVLEDKSLVVYRFNAGCLEEHKKNNGIAYGRVTGVKEPDANSMKKVKVQKPYAHSEQYVQVSYV